MPMVKPPRRPIRSIRSEAGMVVSMMPAWARKIGTVASDLSVPSSE